jgi:hypothetical protein
MCRALKKLGGVYFFIIVIILYFCVCVLSCLKYYVNSNVIYEREQVLMKIHLCVFFAQTV